CVHWCPPGRVRGRASAESGMELDRHLTGLVEPGVERVVVEGSGRIGLYVYLHAGVLDDLVAGLRALSQRQRQPAGAAVLPCDAQPGLRRKPGLGGQVADNSDRLVGKRQHAELLTSDAWMTNCGVVRCAVACGRTPDAQVRAGSGPGPGPATIAVTGPLGRSTPVLPSRPGQIKPAASRPTGLIDGRRPRLVLGRRHRASGHAGDAPRDRTACRFGESAANAVAREGPRPRGHLRHGRCSGCGDTTGRQGFPAGVSFFWRDPGTFLAGVRRAGRAGTKVRLRRRRIFGQRPGAPAAWRVVAWENRR